MQRSCGPSLEGWYQVAAMFLSDALELPTMVLWGGRIRLTGSSDVFLWFGVYAISISFTHRTGSCGDTYWHLQLLDQVGLAMSISFFVNDADPWHEDHEGLQPKNRSNEWSVLVHLSRKTWTCKILHGWSVWTKESMKMLNSSDFCRAVGQSLSTESVLACQLGMVAETAAMLSRAGLLSEADGLLVFKSERCLCCFGIQSL